MGIVVVLALVVGVLMITRGGGGDGSGSAGGVGPILAGPDVMPDDGLVLQPDVVVVRGDEGGTLRAIDDDGATLVLDASTQGAAELAPGSVLLLTGVTVVKVDAVEQRGDDLIVTAAPAMLVDVLSDGELDWSEMAIDPSSARVILGEPELLDENGDAWRGSFDGGVGASVGEHASVLLQPVPGQAMSGRVADFDFSLDYGPRGGGGHQIGLTLHGTGNLKGDIAVNVELNGMNHSGRAVVASGETQSFDWTMSEVSGKADIFVNLASLEQLTSVNTPRFLRVPFSIEWVMPVGGIPFKFSLGATIEARLSFAMANSSLQGRATVNFGGDAGMEWSQGELTVAGQRVTDIEDTFGALAAASAGPAALVFTVEAPKMTFGLGIAKTGVGVFVSSGLVTSQMVAGSTSAVPCMAVATAYVLAAGVDAQFLGYQWDIARKAIADKRWERYAPEHPACAP